MIDLNRTLSFPFREPDWFPKFLIGALFMILSLFGLGIPVIAGYLVQTTQRVMRREHTVLPEWTDVGVMFVVGFKWCVVYVVYLLPVFVAMLPFLFLTMLGVFLEDNGALDLLATASLLVILSLFLIPYSILVTLLLPIVTLEFAKRERISDALNVGNVLRIFRAHWRDALVIALIGVAVSALAALGFLLFLVGILFTTFYAYLVMAHLAGQLYHADTQGEARS